MALPQFPTTALADFCQRHHIIRLAIFGSTLDGDSRADSDLDVLVEFESGRAPGLAFFGMEAELSELLGRHVDLNTPRFLSKYFRNQVMRESRTLYEKAG